MIYTLILKPVLYIYEGFFVHPSPKSDKHSTFLPILPFTTRSLLTTHPSNTDRSKTALHCSVSSFLHYNTSITFNLTFIEHFLCILIQS